MYTYCSRVKVDFRISNSHYTIILGTKSKKVNWS